MKRLVEAVKRVCPVVLESDKKIVSEGVLDSIDLVALVSEIEEEFGIDIPMDYISPENFDSLASMWNMIEKLL